jgi:hypothetical protein
MQRVGFLLSLREKETRKIVNVRGDMSDAKMSILMLQNSSNDD